MLFRSKALFSQNSPLSQFVIANRFVISYNEAFEFLISGFI